MATVLISYASGDRDRVVPILEALRRKGVGVSEVADSDHFEEELGAARAVILAISHTYLTTIFASTPEDSIKRIESIFGALPAKRVLLLRLDITAPCPVLLRMAGEMYPQWLDPDSTADKVADVLSLHESAASSPIVVEEDLQGVRGLPRGAGGGIRRPPPEKSRAPVTPPPQPRQPQPEVTQPAPPAQAVPVLLGASAPREVKPGTEFVANFLAYLPELEDRVREIVESQSRQAKMVEGLAQSLWKKGLEVKVTAAAEGLSVDPAEDQFEWDGQYQILPFDVSVPEQAKEGPVLLKFNVYAAGLRLLRLRVELEVTREVKGDEQASVVGKPARSAFASYASEDRARIADRLASLRIHDAGLDIFMDHLSLIPGQDWQEQLRKEITSRDLFLLFWSPAAEKSKWVDWEWRTAFALDNAQGHPDFEIHPLENGLTPPEELSHLHFGDVFLTIRSAAGGK